MFLCLLASHFSEGITKTSNSLIQKDKKLWWLSSQTCKAHDSTLFGYRLRLPSAAWNKRLAYEGSISGNMLWDLICIGAILAQPLHIWMLWDRHLRWNKKLMFHRAWLVWIIWLHFLWEGKYESLWYCTWKLWAIMKSDWASLKRTIMKTRKSKLNIRAPCKWKDIEESSGIPGIWKQYQTNVLPLFY